MIDFSFLPRRNKTYAGANSGKIDVIYENELYMHKFPGTAWQNKGKCITCGEEIYHFCE